MRPENYKNINELRAFILNKINTSESLDVKYQNFKSKRKTMTIISGGALGFSIFYYIFQNIILGIPSGIPSLFSLVSAFLALLAINKLDVLQDNLFEHNIEYTHQDFENLATILSRNELALFMKEIENKNCLSMWQEFLAPGIEDNITRSLTNHINNKEVHREKYIDSLYKRTSS